MRIKIGFVKNAIPLDSQQGLPFVIKICLATIGVAFYVCQLRLAHFFICGMKWCSFEEGEKEKLSTEYYIKERIFKMKKILALIITVVLNFTLCVCGNVGKIDTRAITSELNGSSWAQIIDEKNYTAWTFDYGIVAVLSTIAGFRGQADQGTFEVTEDAIALTWDEADCGRVVELYYTFENGELKLYSDEEKTMELQCVSKEEGHDKSEATNSDNKNTTLPAISKDEAETIARQEIVNMCCDNSNVSTINIDYGTFNYSKGNLGGYQFEAQGTYLPKDSYGMYGDRVKFNIRLTVDNSKKITVQLEKYSSAY